MTRVIEAKVTTTEGGKTLKIGRARQSFVPLSGPPVMDGAWGMQALGALFFPCFETALFLGVGAGTVPRLVRGLAGKKPEFHGVDNEHVLTLAQAEVGLEVCGFNALYGHGVAAFMDAVSPVLTYDIVFEDLFEEYSKPSLLRRELYIEFTKMVKRPGMYVGNIPSHCARWYRPIVRRAFTNVVQVECSGLDNIVIFGTDGIFDAVEAQEVLQADGRFDSFMGKLTFRTVQRGRRL